MWLVAIGLAALLLGVFRLTTRYEYGPKSRRLLSLDAVGSLVGGLALARGVFPQTSGAYFYLAALGLALPLFVASAVVTVEVLRKGQQRAFDERLAALALREQALLRELDAVDRRVRAELQSRQEAERDGQDLELELEGHRRRVEAWKHGQGVARIRSVKVEEWKAELEGLDPEDLAARRSALEAELAQAADDERRSQLEVRLALAALVAADRRTRAGAERIEASDQAISAAARKRRELEAELASVQAQAADWRRRLSEFLSKEINLG